MIDQERVREMTKLAAYEQREGKKYRQVIRYYRGDFAARHLLKGFLYGTAAYVFYAAGRKSMKRHYRRLKHLGRLYEEQESRTTPAGH